MTFSDACCCICGCDVIDESSEPSWMANFYAIYSLNEEMNNEARLSGRGYIGPVDNLVYATPMSQFESHGQQLRIHLMRSRPGRSPAMRASDRTQAWGFPFHNSCRNLLMVHVTTVTLDIQTLFDLFQSFPIDDGMIKWGHDYGGLARFRIALAPGEEPELQRLSGLREQMPDPYQTPELLQIFSGQSPDALVKHPDLDAPALVPTIPQGAEEDCFAILPPELLSTIFYYLPSSSVVCLKIASRTCTHLPLTDTFWKSRFFEGRELHYVFEAHYHLSSLKGQWRHIFDSVRALEGQSVTLNRRRIWHLSLSLHKLMETASASACHGDPVKSFYEPDNTPDERDWVIASRCLRSPFAPFNEGSRSLYDRTLTFPSGQIEVFISLVDLFGRCYVSGIRILDRSGASFSLGYRHNETETRLSPVGKNVRMSGICLAFDQRGVRGLSVTFDTGTESNWVGDHIEIPKRMLLPVSGPSAFIDSLKGGFDAIKLVYLAVPSFGEVRSDIQVASKFADTALWYPNSPDPCLDFLGLEHNDIVSRLNKDSPIHFNNFGGINGKNIENLINLSVESRECGHVVSINFHYADAKATSHFGFRSADADIIGDFAIDGAGGERIVALDTVHSLGGQLVGFNIHTNRARTGVFPAEYETRVPSHERKNTSVRAEGQTIVGLWGIMTTQTGFLDIGVVAYACK